MIIVYFICDTNMRHGKCTPGLRIQVRWSRRFLLHWFISFFFSSSSSSSNRSQWFQAGDLDPVKKTKCSVLLLLFDKCFIDGRSGGIFRSFILQRRFQGKGGGGDVAHNFKKTKKDKGGWKCNLFLVKKISGSLTLSYFLSHGTFTSWYLHKMVAQNMLSTYEVK